MDSCNKPADTGNGSELVMAQLSLGDASLEKKAEDISTVDGCTNRVQSLFPKVLNLLKGGDGNEYKQRKDYLGTDVLKCRLVCSSWNKAVQDYYQYHLVHSEVSYDVDWTAKSVEPATTGTGAFDSFAVVNFSNEENSICNMWFMQHFDGTHLKKKSESEEDETEAAKNSINPFLGRAMTIEIHERQDLVSGGGVFGLAGQMMTFGYMENNMKILKTYGHHIWYFRAVTPGRMSITNSLHVLTRWLPLMPNLKVFNISSTGGVMDDLTERGVGQVMEQITLHPFPTLKNLHCLKTTDLVAPMFNELIRNNPQVTVLQLTNSEKEYSIYSAEDRSLLPNLKRLCIRCYSGKEFLYFEESAAAAKWKLDELYYRASTKQESEFIPWSRFLQVIQNKWGENLKYVEIFPMPIAENVNDQIKLLEDSLNFRWKLPMLEELWITLKDKASIDFLLPVGNLKKLHIQLLVSGQVEQENQDRVWQDALTSAQNKQVIRFLGAENAKLMVILLQGIPFPFPNLKEFTKKKLAWGPSAE